MIALCWSKPNCKKSNLCEDEYTDPKNGSQKLTYCLWSTKNRRKLKTASRNKQVLLFFAKAKSFLHFPLHLVFTRMVSAFCFAIFWFCSTIPSRGHWTSRNFDTIFVLSSDYKPSNTFLNLKSKFLKNLKKNNSLETTILASRFADNGLEEDSASSDPPCWINSILIIVRHRWCICILPFGKAQRDCCPKKEYWLNIRSPRGDDHPDVAAD